MSLHYPTLVHAAASTAPPPHPHPIRQGVDVKYIDPSYMIRSIPTITTDRIYCKSLGRNAVHGAFAGARSLAWPGGRAGGKRSTSPAQRGRSQQLP